MEQQSPVGRIWQWGEAEHGRLITAVVLAVLGTVCGMVPYFAAAKVIVLLLAGEKALAAYTPWLLSALGGYLIRTVLYIHGIEVIKAFNQGKKSYARFVGKVRVVPRKECLSSRECGMMGFFYTINTFLFRRRNL